MVIPKFQTGGVVNDNQLFLCQNDCIEIVRNEKLEAHKDFVDDIAKKLPTGDKLKELLSFGSYNVLSERL